MALFAVMILTSCANISEKHMSNIKPVPEDFARPVTKAYRINKGDELSVNFFFAPELNEVIQVRPDGYISLMFIQDILAAGKTPNDLALEIKDKLSKYIQQPDLSVAIRSFANRKAFVGGEVLKPGSIELAKETTLVQALTEAGWITPAATPKNILLIRSDNTGNSNVYSMNLENILYGRDLKQNVYIYPGDQILVPPSETTKAARWIDQHIRQILPFSSSVVVTN